MPRNARALGAATTATLLAAATFAASGCKDKGIHGDTGHQTMGAYAEGYNIVIDQVPDLLQRYFKNTPADGPTVKSLTDGKTWLCSGPGFFSMKKTEAEKAFAAAKSSANDELKHLAPMADALWASAMEIVALSEEFCKYMDAEDYKDDNAAKAVEYHAKWVAAADKYRAAQGTFSDALSKIEDAQVVKDIEKHSADKGYSYWFRFFNFEAKKFLTKLRSEPQGLSKHYGELEPSYDALTVFTKGKGAGVNSTFKAYQDAADRFFADLKKMNRALAEAKDDEAKAKVVEDGFDSVVNGYNSLVSFHNSLTQMEGYDQLK